MMCMCVIYIIPLLLFALMYYKILSTAQKQLHKQRIQTFQNGKKSMERTRKSPTLLVLLLVIVFYICWVPSITGLFLSIDHSHLVTQSFIFTISVLVYSNSFLNSILYYFFNSEMRQIYRSYLCTWNKNKLNHTNSRMIGSPLTFTTDRVMVFNSPLKLSPLVTNRKDIVIESTHF